MSEHHSTLPKRRVSLIVWIVLALALGGAVWWLFFKPAAQQGPITGRGRMGPMSGSAAMFSLPTPVKVVQATARNVPIYMRSLGTVTAYNTVTVRSRVAGELVELAFTEGQKVRAGDLLARIDPRAFQVQLDEALGNQKQNQALLANARRDLARYQALYKQDSIARQQLDTQAALVQQYEGTQQTDRAAVENARLQLDYARITAPIGGRLGLRKVDRGNLVGTSDTEGLVVITQTQPVSVAFTLPETQLPEVLKQVRGGAHLQVEAYDRADTRRIATGQLETLDNQIDVATGTLRLKARFDNDDENLFPNQFVNVRLLVDTRRDAIAIPTAAAQQGSAGAFVFVVKSDDTVEVRQVELGPIYGEYVAVNKGLALGERVVTEGTDRLRAGAKVEVVDADTAVSSGPPRGLGASAPGHGPAGAGSTESGRGNRLSPSATTAPAAAPSPASTKPSAAETPSAATQPPAQRAP